jgi:transcriptional regulator with XRE-family HTH domain
MSGTQIAKRFNMSSSALNRIENCDVKTPAIDQVIKILRGTGATGDLLKYLDERYPIIAETYKEVYASTSSEFLDLDLEYFLNDKDKFLIILLALTGSGTSRQEIKNEFGKQGLMELEFLIEKNLLREEGDFIIGDGNRVNLSFETTQNLLSYSVEKCYDATNIRKQDNFIYYRACRVNRDKVIKRVMSILENAEHEIRDLVNDPEFEGNDDFFYGMVCDSLTNTSTSLGGIQ